LFKRFEADGHCEVFRKKTFDFIYALCYFSKTE
jgi:hypothetical protein